MFDSRGGTLAEDKLCSRKSELKKSLGRLGLGTLNAEYSMCF